MNSRLYSRSYVTWATSRRRWRDLASRPWMPVLILGLLVRLLLMPITWHNDALWVPWMAHLMTDGAANVYRELYDRHGPVVLSPTVWAPYLPYYYYVMAGWTGILDSLQLTDPSVWHFSYAGWSVPHLPRAVFLMKLPWVFADLAIWGLALSSLDRSKRARFSWLYLFFPSQLWVSFVMGQNDILPALMTVASLWCAMRALRRERMAWSIGSVLCLGVGGGFKTYPMLLLVPVALFLGHSAVEFIGLVLAGLLPFAAAVLPYLRTDAFVRGALLNQEGMALTRTVLGSGSQAAPLFLIAYGLLLSYLAFAHYRRSAKSLRLLYVGVLSAVLVLSAWPFNWLLWLAPFLAWTVVEDGLPDVLYAATGVYFGAYLATWGRPLGGYTFYPLAHVFRYFPSLREQIPQWPAFERAQGWLFALFVVSTVSLVLLSIRSSAKPGMHRWSLGGWSALAPSLLLGTAVLASTAFGNQDLTVRAQHQVSGPPVKLEPGIVAAQELEMDVPGLSAFDVWVAGPVPRDSHGALELSVYAGERLLERTALPAAALVPEQMNRFRLTAVYPPGSFTFVLEWSEETPLFLGQSDGDTLPDGALSVNGVVTGADLACQTVAGVSWRDVLGTALARFRDDALFAGAWIVSLLALAGLTVVTAFVPSGPSSGDARARARGSTQDSPSPGAPPRAPRTGTVDPAAVPGGEDEQQGARGSASDTR